MHGYKDPIPSSFQINNPIIATIFSKNSAKTFSSKGKQRADYTRVRHIRSQLHVIIRAGESAKAALIKLNISRELVPTEADDPLFNFIIVAAS